VQLFFPDKVDFYSKYQTMESFIASKQAFSYPFLEVLMIYAIANIIYPIKDFKNFMMSILHFQMMVAIKINKNITFSINLIMLI
jgi:hypothetical protein